MSNKETTSSGLGLGTIIFLIFLVLKLTNQIDWSWWLVTSPLWIPIIAVAVFTIVTIIVVVSKKH